MQTDSRPFDADNHYYETLDAFTRHLDPQFMYRGIQVIQRGTHTELLAGNQFFEFVPNPTFDPVIVPGCIDWLFREQVPEGVDPRSLLKVEPLQQAYQDPNERLAVMEEQGLQGALLFPTLAMGVEEALANDLEATMATITAFNSWLDEDWGYSHKDRILAAPIVAIADPDSALQEIDRLMARNVRIVCVRPAPVPDGHGGSRALGDPMFDPIWARLAGEGIPVAFHLADSGYNRYAAAWGGPAHRSFFKDFKQNWNALADVVISDRAIHDTIASLVIGGVFARHPLLRVASVENGSDWVAPLIKRLHKQSSQTPWVFTEDPRDTLRRHLWVAPYYEEDIRALADTLGADKVLFGSDWPHGEGLANPVDFVKDLHGFTDAEVERIMATNVLDLLNKAI